VLILLPSICPLYAVSSVTLCSFLFVPCIPTCMCLSMSLVCLCIFVADAGEDGNLTALGTAEEDVPIDTELSDSIDMEGRPAEYTMSAASDADLPADGIYNAELPRSNAAVSKFVYSLCSFNSKFSAVIIHSLLQPSVV